MRTRSSDPGCALRIHVCFLYGLGPLCRAWSYAEALRSARTVRLDGFRCMQSGIYRENYRREGLSGHVPSDSQEVFRKHQTCAQHRMVIYEFDDLAAKAPDWRNRAGADRVCQQKRADQEHKSSRQLNPFFFSLLSLPGGQSRRGLLFSPLASPPFPSLFHGLFHVPFHGSFRTASVRHNRTLYWKS